MIHEIDLLDIASYIVKPQNTYSINVSQLIGIKTKVERHFSSIEVDIDDQSIRRFTRRFSKSVEYSDDTITIQMDDEVYNEIIAMRTPYLEDKLINIIKL